MVLKKLSSYACSQQINQQQTKFSKNLALTIQETALKASSSLDSINVANSLDKQTLLSETNYFTSDLNGRIFNLQNFALKLDDGSSTKKQLLQIIERMVETSYGVQHSFNIDPDLLKVKLKASVEQVSGESNDMLKVLLEENNPDYKQKLLDVLNDMLSVTDKIKIRNQIRNERSEVLEKLLDEAFEGVWKGLDSFNLDDQVILQHVVHYTRHGVQHMQRVVHYLHANGNHYDRSTHLLFDGAGNEMHNLLASLQQTFQTTNSVKEMKNTIRTKVHAGCGAMRNLATLRDSEDKNGSNTLRETVDAVITDTLANTYQLARGLENSGILD